MSLIILTIILRMVGGLFEDVNLDWVAWETVESPTTQVPTSPAAFTMAPTNPGLEQKFQKVAQYMGTPMDTTTAPTSPGLEQMFEKVAQYMETPMDTTTAPSAVEQMLQGIDLLFNLSMSPLVEDISMFENTTAAPDKQLRAGGSVGHSSCLRHDWLTAVVVTAAAAVVRL
ncbi:hypothetical protein FOL47_008802 [Perkinsus chesapeaki]|uniref:Uncharacterized protein n=1 Tax=Perkinsus chesapeaki TaxID=330153 RepID=A0A7J6LCK5_PERCH|nr:hypothetical protein FOL47_008802 [Perkinsus chesapeaki]